MRPAEIVISGAGVACALGTDRRAFAEAIARGADGLTGSPPMGRLAASPPPPPDPCPRLAVGAARAALRDAGLDPPPPSLALVFGTSAGGLGARALFESDRARHAALLRESLTEIQVAYLTSALGVGGPALAVTTACTASAHAVAHGCLLLSAGIVDLVLAGGADAISDPLVAGFRALGALSAVPCAPFSEPFGMSLGEGACFFVLERAFDAAARGQAALAHVLGYGLSSDAHHATAPDPSGGGLARAMRAALSRAALSPLSVGYVSAHGTGTEANDSAEMRAIRSVFGAAAEVLPISATKSMIGHTLGASAALESLAAIEGMRGGFLPPTIHFVGPRPDAPRDPIPRPRSGAPAIVMKNSAAFGGTNAVLLFGHRPPPPVAARSTEEVYVVGASLLGADGDLEGVTQRLDLDGLDRASRLLTTTAAAALADARIRLRRPLSDRAGLFATTAHLPWDSTREFFESVRTRGVARASAPAFSRMVMNGPAGAASRILSLKGPLSVLAGGRGTTLLALVQASLHLREGDADLIVVATAEVADQDVGLVRGAQLPGDAAAAVCLVGRRLLEHAGLRPLARIAAVALSGGGDPEAALRRLPEAPRRTFVAEGARDTADAQLLVEACRSVPVHGTAVIASSDGRLASAAIRLASVDA